MADKRMFSRTIVKSSRFLKMSATARELYFQLGMDADDDGIVEAWNTMKLCNASIDDLESLVRKGFVTILNSEDLIAYISDWDINNQIRKDRKHDSIYQNLLTSYFNNVTNEQLPLHDNIVQTQLPCGVQPNVNQVTTKCQPSVNQMSTKCQPSDNQMSTKCQPNDSEMTTEDRLVKDSIDKVSLVEDRIDMSQEKNNLSINQPIEIDFEDARAKWNSLVKYGISQLRILGPLTDRAIKLRACIEQFGPDSFDEVIDQIKQSDYLLGKTEYSNGIDFDWAVDINNYTKILEGSYKNINKNKSKVRDFCHGPHRTPEDFDKLEEQLLDN